VDHKHCDICPIMTCNHNRRTQKIVVLSMPIVRRADRNKEKAEAK